MRLTEQQIEWIVQEVVRRLRLLSAGEPRLKREQPANSELSLSEQIVTLDTLKDRLIDVSRVIIQPRAVVTPAVKDELKQRQITLVRQGSP